MYFNWRKVVTPSGIPVSLNAIRGFEDEMGFRLPSDYVAFLVNINGGKVSLDHDIRLPQLMCSVYVEYLYPVSASAPFVGILEARRTQAAMRLCLSESIEIGGDGGTGFFFLLLDGPKRGTVHYIFKDDLACLGDSVWTGHATDTPAEMTPVSSCFDALGETIVRDARYAC